MIIAIDGPAGSGKSTTARAVAAELAFLFIDTGAMYRAVTAAIGRKGGLEKLGSIEDLLSQTRIVLRDEPVGQQVYLNDENVSVEIRNQDITAKVSAVAAEPAVRTFLVDQQRRMAQSAEKEGKGVVMEGRDIGTVVFPEAQLKIFLTADVEERARRRMAELIGKGHLARHAEVAQDIRRRDAYDSSRAHSPLAKAEDAIELDTTGLSIEEQVARIVQLAKELGA